MTDCACKDVIGAGHHGLGARSAQRRSLEAMAGECRANRAEARTECGGIGEMVRGAVGSRGSELARCVSPDCRLPTAPFGLRFAAFSAIMTMLSRRVADGRGRTTAAFRRTR